MQIVQNWALPDCDRYFGPILEREGTFQIERLHAAMEWCPPDRRLVAVDGGAHVGIWTREMVKLGFGVVHSFEPAEDTWECLQFNTKDDVTAGRVVLHHGALGEAHGEALVVDDTTRQGNTGSRFVTLGGLKSAATVPVMVLDALVEGGVIPRIDFLKLDVEGAETLVLRGGCNIIRQCKPVVFVEQKNGIASSRFPVADGDAGRLLESWGYQLVARFRADFIYVWKEAVDGIDSSAAGGGK